MSDMRGFQQCKADTLGHLCAARLESNFSDKLYQKLDIYSSKLKSSPTLEFIYEFLEDQLRSFPEELMPNKKLSSKPPSKPPLTPPPKVKTPIYRSEGGGSHSCSPYMGHSHPLFVYDFFRGRTQAQRHEHVKNSHMCYNCLSHSTGLQLQLHLQLPLPLETAMVPMSQ